VTRKRERERERENARVGKNRFQSFEYLEIKFPIILNNAQHIISMVEAHAMSR
jgi:hypothetical protein